MINRPLPLHLPTKPPGLLISPNREGTSLTLICMFEVFTCTAPHRVFTLNSSYVERKVSISAGQSGNVACEMYVLLQCLHKLIYHAELCLGSSCVVTVFYFTFLGLKIPNVILQYVRD